MFIGWTHLLSKLKRLSQDYGLVLILFISIIAILFSVAFQNPSIQFSIGEPSQKSIYASRDITFQSQEDKSKTQQLIKNIQNKTKPIYSINSTKNKDIRQAFSSLFLELKTAQQDPNYKTPFMSEYRRNILLKSTPEALKKLEFLGLHQLDLLLGVGLKQINKEQLRARIKANLNFISLSSFEKTTLSLFILHIIEPNMFFDNNKTQQKLDETLDALKPINTQIAKGELLVSEGEIITPKTHEKLQLFQQKTLQFNSLYLAGLFFVTSLLFWLGYSKIRYVIPTTQRLFNVELLFFFLCLFIMGTARLVLLIDWPLENTAFFVIPIAIVGFLCTILISYNIAVTVGIILSLLTSLFFEQSFFSALFFLFSHLISCQVCKNIKRRVDMLRCGHYIGLYVIGFATAIGLLQGISTPEWYLWVIALSYFNSLAAAILSLAALPYLERLFNNTSSLSMIEHYNLNHPLIKKMLTQAPGTYHHSLMVAHLAESAAQAIGADVLLCRTASYFHDIGKLNRPQFYIENQETDENPHENLAPKMSKLIIASHTKEGAQLAKEHQLPQAIIDVILSHHGTSLVSFFYQQAKEDADNEGLDAKDFRYDGPKPLSKEEGIVMLADSIEAAARTLKSPNPSKLESLAENIVNEKIADQQLHNCALTLAEIKVIQKTITQQLLSSKHQRIDYQESLKNIPTP